MHCNFCRIHQTLRVTPAMESNLTDHVWDLKELLAALVSLHDPGYLPFIANCDQRTFRTVPAACVWIQLSVYDQYGKCSRMTHPEVTLFMQRSMNRVRGS